MNQKTCKHCRNYGYKKENGDHVCRDGKNFDYGTLRYDPDYAKKCKDYCYCPVTEPEAVF